MGYAFARFSSPIVISDQDRRCPGYYYRGESPWYCRCPNVRTGFLTGRTTARFAAVIHRGFGVFPTPARDRIMADLDLSLFSRRLS